MSDTQHGGDEPQQDEPKPGEHFAPSVNNSLPLPSTAPEDAPQPEPASGPGVEPAPEPAQGEERKG
jgi:hypothetical protein